MYLLVQKWISLAPLTFARDSCIFYSLSDQILLCGNISRTEGSLKSFLKKPSSQHVFERATCFNTWPTWYSRPSASPVINSTLSHTGTTFLHQTIHKHAFTPWSSLPYTCQAKCHQSEFQLNFKIPTEKKRVSIVILLFISATKIWTKQCLEGEETLPEVHTTGPG